MTLRNKGTGADTVLNFKRGSDFAQITENTTLAFSTSADQTRTIDLTSYNLTKALFVPIKIQLSVYSVGSTDSQKYCYGIVRSQSYNSSTKILSVTARGANGGANALSANSCKITYQIWGY